MSSDISHGQEIDTEFTYYFVGNYSTQGNYLALSRKVFELLEDNDEFIVTVKKCNINQEDIYLQTR